MLHSSDDLADGVDGADDSEDEAGCCDGPQTNGRHYAELSEVCALRRLRTQLESHQRGRHVDEERPPRAAAEGGQ